MNKKYFQFIQKLKAFKIAMYNSEMYDLLNIANIAV